MPQQAASEPLRARWRALRRSSAELLSSMRFAIALLALICMAALVGTVLKQQEPLSNYINQFGPFWAQVFGALDLYDLYAAWWFLLILAFLVASTTLCIARNVPKIRADWGNCKENIHLQALAAFGHKASATLPDAPQQAAHRLAELLAARGWRVKLQERPAGWMVAARAGALHKPGWLAAHAAIVLICLGGLLDGNLTVRAQTWLGGKTPYAGAGTLADVPAASRLSVRNPSFRGNLFVPEGAMSDAAVLNLKDGVLVQELPFALELKKFIVEYYPTGMPRVFASEVVFHDKASGTQTPARIEVNRPASYRGVQVYQSSFQDGGSAVTLKAIGMGTAQAAFEVRTHVGETASISNGAQQLTLEVTDLRSMNVENFGPDAQADAETGAAPARTLGQTLQKHLGAAHDAQAQKQLRNIGPSISYKLRDASGQAQEFHNYMLPIALRADAAPEFWLGVRSSAGQAMRYLRIPADENDSMQGFLRLRAALYDPALRAQAVRAYVRSAIAPGGDPKLSQQLQESAQRVMDLFAGHSDPLLLGSPEAREQAASSLGLQGIASFIDAKVPAEQQERISNMLLGVLNGVLYELMQETRTRAGLPPLDMHTPRNRSFMAQAVVALSDALMYPVPLSFGLQDFTQVQASVFQVARAPGKWVVYTGCLLLILGVFAMLYVRQRHLWVWLSPCAQQGQGAQAIMAYGSSRKGMDTDSEFARLAQLLLQTPAP